MNLFFNFYFRMDDVEWCSKKMSIYFTFSPDISGNPKNSIFFFIQKNCSDSDFFFSFLKKIHTVQISEGGTGKVFLKKKNNLVLKEVL